MEENENGQKKNLNFHRRINNTINNENITLILVANINCYTTLLGIESIYCFVNLMNFYGRI